MLIVTVREEEVRGFEFFSFNGTVVPSERFKESQLRTTDDKRKNVLQLFHAVHCTEIEEMLVKMKLEAKKYTL